MLFLGERNVVDLVREQGCGSKSMVLSFDEAA